MKFNKNLRHDNSCTKDGYGRINHLKDATLKIRQGKAYLFFNKDIEDALSLTALRVLRSEGWFVHSRNCLERNL